MIITLIPVHNEEKTIGEIIKKCRRYSFKIFVVDDGSTDKTVSYAHGAGASVIKHKENKGVGAAIKTGHKVILKWIEHKYQKTNLNLDNIIIVNLDGDGQHNPNEIPKLVRPITEGNADLVIGSRIMGVNQDKSMIRRGGNIFFSFLISILTKNRITDAQSGYRAINIRALRLIKLRENFTNRQEMVILAAKQKCRIMEVPIAVNLRVYGKSFIQSKSQKIAFLLKVLLIIVRTFLIG